MGISKIVAVLSIGALYALDGAASDAVSSTSKNGNSGSRGPKAKSYLINEPSTADLTGRPQDGTDAFPPEEVLVALFIAEFLKTMAEIVDGSKASGGTGMTNPQGKAVDHGLNALELLNDLAIIDTSNTVAEVTAATEAVAPRYAEGNGDPSVGKQPPASIQQQVVTAMPKAQKAADTSSPTPQIADKSAPTPQTAEKSTPTPQTADKSAPTPQTADKSAPTPQATDKSAPTPQTASKSAPTPQTGDTSAPTHQATDKSAPTPQTADKSAPIRQAAEVVPPQDGVTQSHPTAPPKPTSSAPVASVVTAPEERQTDSSTNHQASSGGASTAKAPVGDSTVPASLILVGEEDSSEEHPNLLRGSAASTNNTPATSEQQIRPEERSISARDKPNSSIRTSQSGATPSLTSLASIAVMVLSVAITGFAAL